MFCPYCGKQKTEGVAVCPYCGNVDYEESEMETRIIPENMQLDNPASQMQQNMQGFRQNVGGQNMQQGFQQDFQQNAWQQGYPMQQQMGQPGDTQWENPQPQKKKKKKTGLIIGIIIAAVLLIGGGLTAFFLLRGGYSSPEAATEKAIEALEDKDIETFADTLSDGMYDKFANMINSDINENMDADIDVTSGKAMKKSIVQLYKNSMDLVDNAVGSYDIDYEVVGPADKDIDELSEYDDEILAMFDGCEEVQPVEVTAHVEFGEEEYTEAIYDICYKEGRRWYSSMVVATIAPAFLRYTLKSAKANDVAGAETINTAGTAALANEDAYDEISGVIPGNGSGPKVIATAAPGEKFKLLDTPGIKNNGEEFLNELNTNLGNEAPKISYTSEGAAYWTVGMNEYGKIVVWIGTSEGDTRWELQPTIDEEYK